MTSPPPKTLCFDWGIGDHYGWGVYGLNLWVYGTLSERFRIQPINQPDLLYPLDPLTQRLLEDAKAAASGPITLKAGDILLSALGNQVKARQYPKLINPGVTFFESNPPSPQDIAHLKSYDFIVAGSGWNASVLQGLSIATHTVIQGIDLDLFAPRPKKLFHDRFVVFSGGKLEFRKGQDIVVKAFATFAQRHADALLITAWRSPWEKRVAPSINQSGLCNPLTAGDDMHAVIARWLSDNGIAAHQTLNLGATAQRLMPEVFREVDLAVFPNRCEGGTNLVAMEAMASGLPCILSANTGHLDLLCEDACIGLSRQSAVTQPNTQGWGESDVDELLEAMESVYQRRTRITPDAARQAVAHFSWKNSIDNLLALF